MVKINNGFRVVRTGNAFLFMVLRCFHVLNFGLSSLISFIDINVKSS